MIACCNVVCPYPKQKSWKKKLVQTNAELVMLVKKHSEFCCFASIGNPIATPSHWMGYISVGLEFAWDLGDAWFEMQL